MALDPDVPDALRHSAAHALRNIHTADAVPYLAELLTSPNAELRTEAVSGLTEHVMGVRPVPDGPEKAKALDEAFNPGRRKGAPLPVEKEYLHMGRFHDSSQESAMVNYWWQWWQSHKTEFPTVQKE